MARPPLPIGTSDFRQIREDHLIYVDKTALITEVLDDPARVLLFPRPRRFGKTTNLSTLHYFLEKSPEDRSALFADLAVWRSEAARAHFQRYPVIFITLKDVRQDSFQGCQEKTAKLLAELYREHGYLLESSRLTVDEAASFRAIAARRADRRELADALRDLSRLLCQHHGQGVVILIDEYDTPLHEAFIHGYFDEAVGFFRELFSGALKDNRFLRKGVLTGILRIAKESFFSGVNNIFVSSLLQPRYAPYFGFTEVEVADLARQAGSPLSAEELRAWYNGYLFGDTVIYNPWSVLSALSVGKCDAYWVNTANPALLHEVLLRATSSQHAALQAFLQGGTIRKAIDENIVLRQVHGDTDVVWSFLLFSGYLRASGVRQEADGSYTADLSLPNREVRATFAVVFRQWLKNGLGDEGVEALGAALLAGDATVFAEKLSLLLTNSASYLDTAGHTMPPEQLYHVFILGLLLYLEPGYLVRSNREAGHGRSDVMILPRQPGKPGIVLELKVRGKRQSLTAALDQGLRQLQEQDYAAELRAHGAVPIHELAVAFDGKRVIVKALARPARGSRKKS